MKWFANLRIRPKILLGFSIPIIFSIIIAIEGCVAVTSVNTNYAYLLDGPQARMQHLMAIQTEFMTMRYRAANFVMNSGDLDMINNTLKPQYDAAYASLLANLDEYLTHNSMDIRRDPEIIRQNEASAQELRKMIDEFHTKYASNTLALSIGNDFAAADQVLKDAIPLSGEINALLNGILTPAITYKEQTVLDLTQSTRSTVRLIVTFSTILVAFAIFTALLIGNKIAKPLILLGKSAEGIAKGNLDVQLTSNDRDEIGELTRDLCLVADTLNKLTSEMDMMAVEHEKGDMDASIDASYFQGSYKSVAEGINSMFRSSTSHTVMFLDCMTAFGQGDFNANIPQQPGKRAVMNKVLEDVRFNIKSVALDISSLVGDSIQGKLSTRADVSKYHGGWAEIMKDLNNLLDVVIAPIQEASDVLQHVSVGNFNRQVTGNYQGDHQLIKNALNNTITNIASYIDEISSVLNALANGDLKQGITREYVGKFSEIKESLNSIISKFNDVLSEISISADQVSSGAKQISESSMLLATGATEQASAVEELNATIQTINASTSQNADSAKEAEILSNASKQNAAKGDQDMSNMLTSMDGIKESSNSISKIIKVIDDIAFQTNLLALNAAVEAARAGTHGKGFAVVAEEVRNLAGRSQNAAKETAELIEESISRVTEGTKIAGTTAEALRTIVSDVTKVADIIASIAIASQQQALAIGQVTEGISQITEVVQTNSATSEETAASSEELSSQSDMLQNLVSVFKLKENHRSRSY